ncbi:hypothetical protein [Ruegeria conchae]|uniref:Uncharacterized protein n=1 Tax=Ruegeria conchae TaxID=981384 RepID=A0A497ZNN0_9RHOB|nr:hypothetical protein [Ruegeria conchae]RLK07414.1 hypothetical protein CLV75_2537 [Ruegeria conchae]
MATYEQLMQAARQADAAGDSAGAKRFLEIASSTHGSNDATSIVPQSAPPKRRLPQGSNVLMEDDKGGVVYETPNGNRGYTSPGYSTIDPVKVDEILDGQTAGIDRDTLEAIMVDYVEPIVRYPTLAIEGAAEGAGNLAGVLGDALNASSMVPNLAPGTQGFRPISQIKQDPHARDIEKGFVHGLTFLPGVGDAIDYLTDPVETDEGTIAPRGGGQNINETAGEITDAALVEMLGIDRDGPLEPRTRGERYTRRVFEEIGTSAGPLALGTHLVKRGTGAMSRAASKVANKEIALATSAGVGAQTANEIATPDGKGTPASDLLGSLLSSAGISALNALTKPIRRIVGSVTNPGLADDAARQMIAEDVIDAATSIKHASQPVDTSDLADRLRTKTNLERAVPGYQASIGERTGDIGLQTFAEDTSANYAGAQNRRLRDNNAAVNARVNELAPNGDPARFRTNLDQGIEAALTDSMQAAENAQRRFDEALQAVTPEMTAAGRGAAIRAELQNARDAALQEVSDLMQRAESSGELVDLSRLRQRFDDLTARLESEELNTVRRFLPEETQTVRELAPSVDDETDELVALIMADDANGSPVMGPASQVGSVRSGLAEAKRNPSTTPQQKRMLSAYESEAENFLRDELSGESMEALDEARRLRAEAGRRFEEPDAIGRTLAETGRGTSATDLRGYQLPDEAVPGRFVRPNAGETDFSRLMAEAGDAPEVRRALQDQLVSDAQRRGAFKSPEALSRFLADYNVQLEQFPETRRALEEAGASSSMLDTATKNAETLRRDITPGGKAPEGQYTRYASEDVVGSINNLVRGSDSGSIADRTHQLIKRAGGTESARKDLRAGFWQWIDSSGAGSSKGRFSTTLEGEPRWNAKAMVNNLNDPKVREVAKELWPGEEFRSFEVLEDIFRQLEAATPGRTTAAGRSGTAQSMARLEAQRGAATTARRASADIRAVGQGRMAVPVALTGWVADGLRNLSVKTRRIALEKLTASVANDPDLLANILEEFNPAEMVHSSRLITQKYGVRASQVLEVLRQINETHLDPAASEDDELLDHIFAD